MKEKEKIAENTTKRYLDSQKHYITWLYAKRQLNHIGQRLDLFVDKDVLDVGCGRGVLETTFRDCSRSFISSDIVDTNFYGLDVKICSAENLMFSDNQFDSVFLLGVIEHVEKPNLAIDECRRVLRSGGKLIVSIPNGFMWQFMRLIGRLIPGHWQQHSQFGQKELHKLMERWTLLVQRPIIPGLFWLYEFEVKK